MSAGFSKIIDARSGRQVQIGDTIRYHGGETMQLLDVKVGVFTADLLVRSRWHENPGGAVESWVKGPVRYFHPKFLFRRIVFIPT